MEQIKRTRKRAYVDSSLCVGCGCCVKVCPTKSISIYHGLYASVVEEKCVGCGKCVRECPASIIALKEVQS